MVRAFRRLTAFLEPGDRSVNVSTAATTKKPCLRAPLFLSPTWLFGLICDFPDDRFQICLYFAGHIPVGKL